MRTGRRWLRSAPPKRSFAIQLAAFGEFHHVGMQRIELRGRHRLVVVPPDIGFAGGIAHDEFVVGGAAGVLAGEHHERAVLGDMAFTGSNGALVKRGRGKIPVHRFQIPKPMAFKPERASLARVLRHDRSCWRIRGSRNCH